MKKNKDLNARNLVLTLMIIGGCCFSCEKLTTEQESQQPGEVIVNPIEMDQRGSGDDEEDPIIEGLIIDTNGGGVANANVKIFKVGSTSPEDERTTDAQGNFQMIVEVGDYYFKITVGTNVTTTNTFSILQDSNVVITV